MSPFFSSPRPRVFAHRGGSALAPENTIAAFDNGLQCGADGLELDVRRSADGVVMVLHDAILDRTTTLRGPVADRASDELVAAGVPKLADVLSRYPATPIIVELKLNDPAFAVEVIDVVRANSAVDRVCLGSFGTRVLRAVRALEPRIATSASREEVRWSLYRSWLRLPRTSAAFRGYQVPEWAGHTRVISPRFVADAHRAGLGVQVWTVDLEDHARRLLAWGVDALISDRPDRIAPLVARYR
ncbi:MAG TPA: glycerophosphodiester phosphodiesterase family protein [Vicinamibacterales bacterium]|jgi:glycerophosphoryl diester phosphodiesterase